MASGTRVGDVLALKSPLRGLPLSEQTLPALLTRQAERFADKTCVSTTAGEHRSFEQLRDGAAAWAGLLAEIGVERGGRVAAISSNRIELVELLLGCAWMGAVAVPLDPMIRGAQLAHALRNSAASTLVLETEHLDALARVPPPASLEHVWLLDRERPHRAHGYRCEPLPAPVDAVAPAAVAAGDTLAILYAARAGGIAKGACCPHGQFFWQGVIGSEFLAIGPDDVCFTTLPLFHTTAINSLCQALAAGAAWVIAPRFIPARYWRLAAEHHATRAYLTGEMTSALLAQSPSKDDRGHSVAFALAPATPAASHERFEDRFGVQLFDAYASAETNQVTGIPGDPRRPGSFGRALEEFELAVVDECDVRVEDTVPGELVVRPRVPFSMFSGYHDMPQATVAAWRNLWFHTGERVARDADGWYRLVAGEGDAIRRRGESIASVEVERTLQNHPAVAAAAVFQVPSALGPDEVMAAIVLEPGGEAEPAQLVRFCEQRIARFAIPRFIDFVETLPLSAYGLVRRSELRERGVSPATWDRERSEQRFARH
jgi:crotonobetaine/carnitine-CoA ligase